jgi:PAS domain S-box-containing protein
MFTTLRSKILAGFAAVIAINVVFGLWAIFQFSQVGESATDAIATNYELITNTVQLGYLADKQLGLLQQMLVSPGVDQYSLQFDQRTADFRIALAKLGGNQVAASRRDVLNEIGTNYDEFLRAAQTYRNSLGSQSHDQARDILYRVVQPAAITLKENCFNILYRNQYEIGNVRDELSSELKQALLFVGAATLLASLLGIIGGSFYSRWSLRPIERLTQAVKNLTGGRLGERILITTADELGDLSFEFNRMIERLRHYEAMNIEQLLLEKRKVETIVHSIATPIIVVDAEMRLVLINSAALAMFRLPIEEPYIGEAAEEVINDRSVIESLTRALQGRDDRESNSPDIYMVRDEGAERFYAVGTLPLETSSAVSGVVAVFSDITHFKELDRLKSDFLAKVSHEFRTPLSSIIMSLDILREGIVGEINDQQRDLLNASKDDCRRLSKLITELLELSRMEANMRQRKLVQLDLAQVIDSVLRPHRLPAREKGVELIERIAPAIPPLWAEPEELRWLFNNLISNALRHTDAGGTIRGTASRSTASTGSSRSSIRWAPPRSRRRGAWGWGWRSPRMWWRATAAAYRWRARSTRAPASPCVSRWSASRRRARSRTGG